MKKIMLALLLSAPFFLEAQELNEVRVKKNKLETGGGQIQLGMRSTTSLFGETGYPGLGFGGQFRIKLSSRLNTEWFADVINTDINGLGKRFDAHIGWSVMFYLLSEDKIAQGFSGRRGYTGKPMMQFVPYLIAGHCFDYTKVSPFSKPLDDKSDKAVERWSSATQAGLGVHWNFSRKADLSFATQYMIHLGKDVHTHVEDVNGVPTLNIEQHDEFTLEGHLLLTLSLNFKIAELW